MQEIGDKISGVGEKMMPITAGIVAVGTIAVKTGAEFDAEMSKVGVISGKVADEDLPVIVESTKEMGLAFEKGADSTETAMNIIQQTSQLLLWNSLPEIKYHKSESGFMWFNTERTADSSRLDTHNLRTDL